MDRGSETGTDILGTRARRRRAPTVASVCRAFGRLVADGRVRRVETLSAYRVRDAISDVFPVCASCGKTSSLVAPADRAAFLVGAAGEHFAVPRLVAEALGRCRRCAGNVPEPPPSDTALRTGDEPHIGAGGGAGRQVIADV